MIANCRFVLLRRGLAAAIVLAALAHLPLTAAPAAEPCGPTPVFQQGREDGNTSGAGSIAADDTITIATLNTHAEPRITEAVAEWVARRSIDILLLQETGPESDDGTTLADIIGRRLQFGYASAPARDFDQGSTLGLAVMSRYDVNDARTGPLDYFRLRFRSRCRVALAATIDTPAGPIRLVNVHLDTRINSGSRVTQLTTALKGLDGFKGPSLVGGDFNSMDVGWVWSMLPFPYFQRQRRAVREALATEGFSTPFADTPPTFRALGLPLWLDWLYLKSLDPVAWGVDSVPFSDHRGLWADVRLSGAS